jgi:hypothetical protein
LPIAISCQGYAGTLLIVYIIGKGNFSATGNYCGPWPGWYGHTFIGPKVGLLCLLINQDLPLTCVAIPYYQYNYILNVTDLLMTGELGRHTWLA